MEKNLTKALCSVLVSSIKSEIVPEIVASVTREIIPAVDRIIEDRIAALTSGINDAVTSQTNTIDQRLSLLCDALDRLEACVSALQSTTSQSSAPIDAPAQSSSPIDNDDAQLHVGEAHIQSSDTIDDTNNHNDNDDENDDENDDPIAALLSSMGFDNNETSDSTPKSKSKPKFNQSVTPIDPAPTPKPTPIADTDDAELAFSALSTIRRRTAIRQYMLENGVSSAETRDPSYLTVENAIALRGAVAFWNFCLESVL